jgi:hypothetical protein
MYVATPIIFTVMGATTAVSLYAIFRLRKSPPSPSRQMATVILTVLVLTAIVFFLSYGGTASPVMTAVAILPQIMSIWVSALLLHLIMLFWRNDGRGLKPATVALAWSPAAAISVVLLVAALSIPGAFPPGGQSDFFHVRFGALGQTVAAVGTLYLVCSLVLLALILRSGSSGARREMSLTFALMALTFFDAPLAFWPLPGVPGTTTPLVFQSLVAIALAYAVIRECPLIVPRMELMTAEAPCKKLFAPGSIHLCLHKDRQAARSTFASLVKGGSPGLWVTRQSPREGRAAFGLVNTPFVWLTSATVEGEVCISPADTGRLSKAFMDFLGAAGDSIILFEGLEYISSNIGFKGTLNLLQYLNDKVMSSTGVLLVALDSGAFKPEELALLRSEATAVHDEGDGECAPVMGMAGAPGLAGKIAGRG